MPKVFTVVILFPSSDVESDDLFLRLGCCCCVCISLFPLLAVVLGFRYLTPLDIGVNPELPVACCKSTIAIYVNFANIIIVNFSQLNESI